ncbi:MAG: hypothetical protein J6Y02_12855 [Pseudobutyrivibrio sp.]|nr:hypothetical protein [Pseudobutyrivibrio sp.]
MAKLKWHETGKKYYETGIKDVALYIWDEDAAEYVANDASDETFVAGKYYSKTTVSSVDTYTVLDTKPADWDTDSGYLSYYKLNPTEYSDGVAWNGVTSLSETPSGGEASDLYADDDKYLSLYSEEQLGASIEAYTYPDEWEQCDGAATVDGVGLKQQTRKMFGLSYITTVGNDTLGNDEGEKLHLLYGCKASPSDRSYATINDSPEAITFSWELTTTKQEVTGYKKTALITIDTTKLTNGKENAKYVALKALVQGSANNEPTLPKPDVVLEMMEGAGLTSGEG